MHEQQLQTETQLFRQKTDLLDLARSYRKLNVEQDPSNERSTRLSEFYVSVGQIIEGEIRELDKKIHELERESHHQQIQEDAGGSNSN